eukprot:7689565-Prorocentrum_lima.AAC.1
MVPPPVPQAPKIGNQASLAAPPQPREQPDKRTREDDEEGQTQPSRFRCVEAELPEVSLMN